jgi:hypothetical protein
VISDRLEYFQNHKKKINFVIEKAASKNDVTEEVRNCFGQLQVPATPKK